MVPAVLALSMATKVVLGILVAASLLTGGAYGYVHWTTEHAPGAFSRAGEGGFVSAPAILVADEVGDARDHAIDFFDAGSQCRFGCGRPPPLPPGVPARVPGTLPAPWMDLTEVGFVHEERETLHLAIRVATLTEGFPELTPAPGYARGVDYIGCFGAELGERCVWLSATPRDGGAALVSTFHVFSEACGGALENQLTSARPTVPFGLVSECAFEVPATIAYGTPAEILFAVPKAFAEFDGAPPAWTHVRANVTTFWLEPAAMTHLAYSKDVPMLPHHHDHYGPAYPSGIGDEIQRTPTEIRFTPGVEGIPLYEGALANAGPGLFYGDSVSSDPVFDLLETAIRDEGDEIVVTQTFAGVSRASPDFEHSSSARIEHGAFFEFGAFHQGDDWHAYVGTCIHFHCLESSYLKLPLEVHEGAPGALEFRIPREYFGNPHAGARLTFLMTLTQALHPSWYDEGGKENVHTMSFLDQHVGTLPYTFAHGAVDREVDGHSH